MVLTVGGGPYLGRGLMTNSLVGTARQGEVMVTIADAIVAAEDGQTLRMVIGLDASRQIMGNSGQEAIHGMRSVYPRAALGELGLRQRPGRRSIGKVGIRQVKNVTERLALFELFPGDFESEFTVHESDCI